MMRHAERRDASWDPLDAPHVDEMWPFDPTLSKKGYAQAESAARALTDATGGFELVVSSPFRRCVETALAVCRASNAPLFIDPELGEIFETGIFGNKKPLAAHRP